MRRRRSGWATIFATCIDCFHETYTPMLTDALLGRASRE